LERLQGNAFDLILLDLGLPDSGGLDTFRRLKDAAADLPIVILTGNTDQEAAITAVQEGAQDFLIKGQITGALIIRAILYALERKRAPSQRPSIEFFNIRLKPKWMQRWSISALPKLNNLPVARPAG
jgi:DNA-binding response OmpR family regulator